MMSSTILQVRPARLRDLLACARVCVRSIQDLNRRLGKPPLQTHARDLIPFMRHALRTDPRGFQVAVSEGKIVCYPITILRGKTHFLAQFFSLPRVQSRGIGRKILTRAFEEPRPPRDAIRCLVASLDVRAESLYMKFGMQPRTTIYHLVGKPSQTTAHGDLELRQVGATGKSTRRSREIAARFDARLRGARRDVDQRFFMTAAPGSRFFEAQRKGRTAGYVVIRENGAIGPAGIVDASLSGDLLAASLERVHELGSEKAFVWVPGLNAGAVRAAFAAGLKVDFLTVWMAAAPIGNLETYIPSGGVLF